MREIIISGPVIFELPGSQFAAIAGELERLGVPSYSYRWVHDLDGDSADDRILIRAISPPYFSLLRALDSRGEIQNIRAFVEQSPRVWVSAGCRHPLTAPVAPAEGKILFLRPAGHSELLDDRPFIVGNSPLSFSRGAGSSERSAVPPLRSDDPEPRLNVRLALRPNDGDVAPAEMWILRDDPLGWLEQFVRDADDRQLMRFTFALTNGDGRPCMVLRVRSHKDAPPVLVGLPRRFRPLLKLANLFAPCGHRLTPMPRRDALRRLLCPDSTRVTWLKPLDNGNFQAESISAAAFRPLHEWTEYRIDEPIRKREAWKESNDWSFAPFAIKPDAPPRPKPIAEKPPPIAPIVENKRPATDPPKRGILAGVVQWLRGAEKKKDAAPPAMIEPAAIPMEDAVHTALQLPQGRDIKPPSKINEPQERVKSLEARFASAISRMTPGERLELWPELAAAYYRSNNHTDSAICWLNALWGQDKLSPLWAWGWLKAEAASTDWNPNKVRLADWLAAPPKPERARALAAYAVWAARQEPHPPGFLANLNRLQAYLEERETDLSLRAAWLARTALTRLARGDVLGLARMRDRLFSRLLREGFSLDKDAPTIVRASESDDPDRLKLVGKWLASKEESIRHWIERLGSDRVGGESRRDSMEAFGLQAEVPSTRAYADLMISWGLARLGEKSEGARLRDDAWQRLSDADSIHIVLKSAFAYRIHQAREGKSGGPFPAELLGRIEALPADDRYLVDRLRQHSRILDPTERIDAYWASTMRNFRGWSELKNRLLELPGLESAALNERVEKLLVEGKGESASALPAILIDVLDVAPRLDERLAANALELTHAALDRARTNLGLYSRLLERALLAAASLFQPTKVQLFAHRFAQMVEDQRGMSGSASLESLTKQTFRCLRRVGLKSEADRVLFQIHGWVTRGEDIDRLRVSREKDWPALVRTLLHIAAGWYYCGRQNEGFAILEPVSKDLFNRPMSIADRTALALTYAATLGQVPAKIARGRFDELFKFLKKISIFGRNTHYTLQPLELVDTVIHAVVSEDFNLGPTVRGWLDDDEFLVRQRIHDDLNELMKE